MFLDDGFYFSTIGTQSADIEKEILIGSIK
jgi:hypothetical protein